MAEPARLAPMSPPPEDAAGRPPSERSPTLGLVALLLAPAVVALTLATPWVVGALRIQLTDVQFISLLFLGETAGMAVVLVLGLVAVVRRRGRPLGIAAIVLALLVNPFTLSLVLWAIRQLSPQG